MKLLAFAVLASAAVHAQSSTASLSGVITDPSGAIIPSVDVAARHVDTNRGFSARTDNDGRYNLLTLPIGRYSVSATAQGFKTLEREVELTVNQSANLNLRMQVGQTTEVVDVTAQAPLVNATNSTVGTLMESRQVLDLPLNGRNFTQLIALTPGVANVDVSQGGAGPAVQGQRNRSNLYLADGVINSNLAGSQISVSPPLDSIQEFRVESVHNDAEFGGASGAYVNLSTKAGTNRLHGTAYDFLRNDVLNARNTFQPTVPKFRNNIYGFSVGAPLLIPKVYNGKDRTWFFVSHEGVKNRASSSSITRVANAAERAGNFAGTAVFDPYSTRSDPARPTAFLRDPFPGGQVPAARFHRIAARYLADFSPLPNFTLAGTVNNYLVTGPNKSDTGIWVFRVDHTLSQKDRVSLRSTRSDASSENVGISPVITLGVSDVRNWSAEWNRIISPTTLLTVRYGYNRNRSDNSYRNVEKVSEFIGFADSYNSDAFSTRIPDRALFPGYGIQNYAGLVGTGYSPTDNFPHSGAVNLQKTIGRHSFKAGFNLMHFDYYTSGISQTLNFTAQPTQNPAAPAGTGQPLASFLLGVPSNATRPLGNPDIDAHGWMYAIHLSDTFRVNGRLSLNYGVRGDKNGNFLSRSGTMGSFDRTTGAWLLDGPINIPGAIFQGPNVRRGFVDPDWNNFSPRLGAAYSITQKTVVRAGMSTFYEMFAGWLQIAQGNRNAWPHSTFQSTDTLNATVPTVFIDRPFRGLPDRVDRPNPFPSAGYHLNRFFKTPYVHEWNVSVERQFSDRLAASVTYVGAKGRTLECCGLTNYSTVLAAGNARAPERVPYPNMLVFRTNDNSGRSDYHGLQTKIEQRFHNGLSFSFNYTFSKSIDLACSGYIGAEGCNLQQPYNLSAERGVSSYDLTHIANATFIYEIPFKPRNYAVNLIAGGWQTSGILNWRSGLPLTPGLAVDNANNSGSQQRPNLVGDAGLAGQSRLRWFNTAAFALPARYTYGNAGRNILRGPAAATQSLSLFKNFAVLPERLKVQFRSDFFNAFNHPLLGSPGLTFDTPTFGQINSASGNRTIQMSLKAIF